MRLCWQDSKEATPARRRSQEEILAFQRFDVPFSVIHDSVLCRATDMSLLSHLVRETYMVLFAENDFLTDFAKQIGATEAPPIIGTLKPESVINSTYFFC
jgi:hypothetical protein